MDLLKKQLKIVWAEINPEVLTNLIDGMPYRVKKCVDLQSVYIGK